MVLGLLGAEITLYWASSGDAIIIACLCHELPGFAIMDYGTFLGKTGMLKAAVRRDELLVSSPVLLFFF